MRTDNWIKIHRKFILNDVFLRDDTAWKVFMILLSQAGPDGRVTFGMRQLGKLLNMNHTVVSRAITRLENCGMVKKSRTTYAPPPEQNTHHSTHHPYTELFICNWGVYQGSDAPTDAPLTHHTCTKNATIVRNKNKELKNNTNTISVVAEDSENHELLDLWKKYSGGTIRNKKRENIRAAEALEKDVGRDGLIALIKAARLIKDDKYQKRNLQQELTNYLGIEKNFEVVQDYVIAHVRVQESYKQKLGL